MKIITEILKEIEFLSQELRNCVRLGNAIDEHGNVFGDETESAKEHVINEEKRLIKEIDKLKQKLLKMGYCEEEVKCPF